MERTEAGQPRRLSHHPQRCMNQWLLHEFRELRTDLVYRLRVIVDNPDGGLRQGMPVTVTLSLNDAPAAKGN